MESPPNFSSAQRARVRATMASPATPAAGTTHTSERSYAAFTGSRVEKSTDCNGRRRVEIGLRYPRTRISCPVETPPSMHPALLRVREQAAKPEVEVEPISSWAAEPGAKAAATPEPISTAFTACNDVTAAASRASRRLYHST